ncbi:hypothetical protein Pla22_30440 [Rubripirellula amarantea]|uniref:PKD domain-containing protein n=1 Tax=Rubripirellula amarantea TaxID=2527999 RepID=A0A5C5WK12_9BACT|nr:dockerin type I domain-containing protein [Rubripirellula amarantea]TWT50303.1 hypothetical protein Pla22_30440 [Rubripirellula amarantea]
MPTVPRLNAPSRQRRRSPKLSRPLRFESLEIRRLMIAEAAAFELSQNLSTEGLTGNISGEVFWGDGQKTNVTGLGTNETGKLKIKFDYSLDTRGFFKQAGSKAALEYAANSFVSLFADELEATGTHPDVNVTPVIDHPTTGVQNFEVSSKRNVRIAANEVLIFAGSRNFDNERGLGPSVAAVGGIGSLNVSIKNPATFFSCGTLTQTQCNNQAQAKLDSIVDDLRSRGQTGSLKKSPDDFAAVVGSIAFDQPRDFYFGTDPEKIGKNQTDFISIAIHELAHAFGFGLAPSWNRLVNGSRFDGTNANQAYEGDGKVPLTTAHWAQSVANIQSTNMTPQIDVRARGLSTLDLAGMYDIGWEKLESTTAKINQTHVYADDGQYLVTVVLRGSTSGTLTHEIRTVNVTNVAPSLTSVGNQTVEVGKAITLDPIGTITDPGFSTPNGDPASEETFSYSIDWGDGTIDDGNATVTTNGKADGTLTSAKFKGTHVYETTGVKTVKLRVFDDNQGSDEKTFTITVTPKPELSLKVSKSAVDENAGNAAATLTITRSGPAKTFNQTITVASSDTTELTVDATAVIPAGESSVTIPLNAVNDNLLDGTVAVELTASGGGVESGRVTIDVRDEESLTAALSSDSVVEGGSAVNLTIRRSNTDTDEELVVSALGFLASQIDLPREFTIPAGQASVRIPVIAVDNDVAAAPKSLNLVFRNDLYTQGSATLEVLDDEPPVFQNPENRYDVNGLNGTSANDALIIINELGRRQDNVDLDPTSEKPDPYFLDVNGDYKVTARDALIIINQIARESNATSEDEAAGAPTPVVDRTKDETLWSQLADEAIGQMF